MSAKRHMVARWSMEIHSSKSLNTIAREVLLQVQVRVSEGRLRLCQSDIQRIQDIQEPLEVDCLYAVQ